MPADFPPSIKQLMAGLRRLPGVGSRNAERMALAVLKTGDVWPEQLAESILQARKLVTQCGVCGFYSESGGRCAICSDTGRDASLLCVVETAHDVLPIERAGVCNGFYHCLGGRLSPLDGVGPDQLAFAPLIERIRQTAPSELIVALGTDVEGETTHLFLIDLIRREGLGDIVLSRPAQGLPIGGSLEYADALTLGRALQERRKWVSP